MGPGPLIEGAACRLNRGLHGIEVADRRAADGLFGRRIDDVLAATRRGTRESPADVQCVRQSALPAHTCDKIRLMSADVTGRIVPAPGFRPPRDIGRVSTCLALARKAPTVQLSQPNTAIGS